MQGIQRHSTTAIQDIHVAGVTYKLLANAGSETFQNMTLQK
jgi:hypothetical protein